MDILKRWHYGWLEDVSILILSVAKVVGKWELILC